MSTGTAAVSDRATGTGTAAGQATLEGMSMRPKPHPQGPGAPTGQTAPCRREVWAEAMAADMPGDAGMMALEHLLDRAEARETET